MSSEAKPSSFPSTAVPISEPSLPFLSTVSAGSVPVEYLMDSLTPTLTGLRSLDELVEILGIHEGEDYSSLQFGFITNTDEPELGTTFDTEDRWPI